MVNFKHFWLLQLFCGYYQVLHKYLEFFFSCVHSFFFVCVGVCVCVCVCVCVRQRDVLKIQNNGYFKVFQLYCLIPTHFVHVRAWLILNYQGMLSVSFTVVCPVVSLSLKLDALMQVQLESRSGRGLKDCKDMKFMSRSWWFMLHSTKIFRESLVISYLIIFTFLPDQAQESGKEECSNLRKLVKFKYF